MEYALILLTTVGFASIVFKAMKSWGVALCSGAERAVSAALAIF